MCHLIFLEISIFLDCYIENQLVDIDGLRFISTPFPEIDDTQDEDDLGRANGDKALFANMAQ
ncbi:hypothetical protein [Parachitinimonas caeni]|uniref:Uncharacterized protein n=1 Tax=Parachitinimonas caeni TaxID=3031301 RepID=A0ABT7E057_9NEIS|nr:hypothetical protein [Parachitinimonas caeni]MDK2125685.1 hypothetical protein [Parachitinimonas caeni]